MYFKIKLVDYTKWKLSDLDWEILEGLEAILRVSSLIDAGWMLIAYDRQVPHSFQQSMSFKATLVLSCVIIYFEMLIMEWESLGEHYKVLKPWIEIGLHWATKYYIKMNDTNIYVVTMCKFSTSYITTLTANLNL